MQVTTVLFKICSLAIILAFCGCRGEPKVYEPSGKVVKVGFLGPLTGINERWGSSSLLGVKAALQIQPFLLNGDRLEIIEADDMNDPEMAQRAVKKLVEDDDVTAILLASGSNVVLAAKDLIEEYKVPTVALLATHPEVTSGEYTVQVPFDDMLQGTIAALYVMDEMIVDRVVVCVDSSDEHSKYLTEIFTKTFKEAGGEVEIITIPSDAVALEKALAKSRDREEMFLYLPLHAADVVEITKISKKLGYDPKMMLSDGLLSRIVLEYENDLSLVEGMVATDVYSHEILTKDYGEKLVDVFEDSFAKPKTTFAALGAEGTSILLGAMDRCGNSQDVECVNRNLHDINDFLGVNSKISINSDGKAERPIFINTIVNGKLRFEVMVY